MRTQHRWLGCHQAPKFAAAQGLARSPQARSLGSSVTFLSVGGIEGLLQSFQTTIRLLQCWPLRPPCKARACERAASALPSPSPHSPGDLGPRLVVAPRASFGEELAGPAMSILSSRRDAAGPLATTGRVVGSPHTQLDCKLKGVTHAPSALCPLRGA